MAKSSEPSTVNTTQKAPSSLGSGLVFFTLVVFLLALIIVQLDTFETVAYPMHELGKPVFVPAIKNAGSLSGLEKIGFGQLIGAEDIAYDPKTGVVYTGCEDGWIKRVRLNDSVVENWVHTGGRPLGIAITYSGYVFVADAYKGLLKVSINGELAFLTDEAEGVKFGLADGVAIAKNGMVYFTDATYKYNLFEIWNEILEGRPHGRLLSYDPSTRQTKVLVRDLYFANGVEVSPNQEFIIFCETFMRRCSRYYVQGERKGSVDIFVDNLPGLPDNIRYDGKGHYWLALPGDNSFLWSFIQRYPFVRKIFASTLNRLNKMPNLEKFGGVIILDLGGKPIGGYYDNTWKVTTSAIRIGENLYMSSVTKSYILRLHLTQSPFTSMTQNIHSQQ